MTVLEVIEKIDQIKRIVDLLNGDNDFDRYDVMELLTEYRISLQNMKVEERK